MFQEMRDIENKRKGMEEGKELGLKEGKELAILGLVEDETITAEVAAEKLGITVDEVMERLENRE